MLRIISGVIGGFLAWAIAWFGGEQILSAIWPEAFGAPQRAFQAAIENGGPFTADTWYHVLFTALLIPMTIMGGRLSGRADKTRH